MADAIYPFGNTPTDVVQTDRIPKHLFVLGKGLLHADS